MIARAFYSATRNTALPDGTYRTDGTYRKGLISPVELPDRSLNVCGRRRIPSVAGPSLSQTRTRPDAVTPTRPYASLRSSEIGFSDQSVDPQAFGFVFQDYAACFQDVAVIRDL
jgi:hypothetical protein